LTPVVRIAGAGAAAPHSSPVAERLASHAKLAVVRLALANFRSYAAAEIKTSGRPVVLAGANGAGKTNVLDAISLLSPGRGLRGTKLSDHIRKAPQAAPSDALWAVNATISRDGETYEIGTGLVPSASGSERRLVHLNGAPAQSSADLGDVIQMTWLTPAMDRLFTESASGRRRFLDRLVLGFDAVHAQRSLRYEHAMQERARLLKYGPRDPAWLDGLEAEMAEAGIAIALARAETIEKLNGALAKREEAGAFPCAQLALVGDVDLLLQELGDGARAALQERLGRLRMRDAEMRRTTLGPHVSDLAVRHAEKRMDAKDCSTGEQKALLVSIVLADAWELARLRGGRAPLLLLDEIAAHLDSRRRAALFEEILALRAQAWMTGTDLSLFETLASRADIYIVADGELTLQE
jgi:DNA replication and repair protein RecF